MLTVCRIDSHLVVTLLQLHLNDYNCDYVNYVDTSVNKPLKESKSCNLSACTCSKFF